MTQKWEQGVRGEDIATEYLRKNKFLICERNWRDGRYEIDIIASRWDEIHFVEVKTRKKEGFTTPEQAIDKDKFTAISHAARTYLRMHRDNRNPVFDLIAVEIADDGKAEVRMIEGAMEFHW